MIAAIVLAAVTATAAPTSLPAQTQTQDKPLREVVYHVAVNLQTNQMHETFGGYNPSGTTGVPDTLPIGPSSTGSRGGSGVITVDVMSAGPDGTLGVRVVEQWGSGTQSLTFNGLVAPDGSVYFPPSTITDATRELLSYFGTKFAPSDGLTPTTHWHTVQPYADAQVDTDYSVIAINNGVAKLEKKQTVKPMDAQEEGVIEYDAISLVPISGRVTQRMSASFESPQGEFAGGGSTSQDKSLSISFERVSDTHVTPPNQ